MAINRNYFQDPESGNLIDQLHTTESSQHNPFNNKKITSQLDEK